MTAAQAIEAVRRVLDAIIRGDRVAATELLTSVRAEIRRTAGSKDEEAAAVAGLERALHEAADRAWLEAMRAKGLVADA